MTSELYRDLILDHYKNPRNVGKIDAADRHGRLENVLCGDVVEVFVKYGSDGKVKEVKWTGEGCALSQASASLLSEMLVGKTEAQLKALTEQDVLSVVGQDINPSRKKCATLGLDALKEGLK